MVEVGVVPINFSHHEVPTQENKYSCQYAMLEPKGRSRGLNECLLAIAIAIEEHVLALSRFSVEVTGEDIQKWAKTYKEDKSHVTMHTKLR